MPNKFIIDTRQRIDRRNGKMFRTYKDVSLTIIATIHKVPPLVVEELSRNIEKGSGNLMNINRKTYDFKPFSYASLFSGIGGFEQALNSLGGTCVFSSEIDKFAAQAYEALYSDKPAGDITKIDDKDIPEHDLLVGGFPCQAFSVAGKRKGFEDTRGTLFFDIARIAAEKKPKALLLENVKGLVNHDKGNTLDTMIKTLNDIGYVVDFDVLNSKYFGVPQNRERVFIVAIREDLVDSEPFSEESTIGQTVVPRGKRRIGEWASVFNFDWPEQTEVTTRLRDILESEVDEKYYLDEEKTARLVAQLEEGYNPIPGEINVRTNVSPSRHSTGNVFDAGGISPTVKTMQGGMDKLKITEPQMLGRVDIRGNDSIKRTYSTEGISPTLTSMGGGHREPKIAEAQEVRPKYRIRKLTPLECWRLQGFPDEAHETVKQVGISDSQRYKQAGNAVTVNVVESIGERLIPMLAER